MAWCHAQSSIFYYGIWTITWFSDQERTIRYSNCFCKVKDSRRQSVIRGVITFKKVLFFHPVDQHLNLTRVNFFRWRKMHAINFCCWMAAGLFKYLKGMTKSQLSFATHTVNSCAHFCECMIYFSFTCICKLYFRWA